jgi:hypothetical protein
VSCCLRRQNIKLLWHAPPIYTAPPSTPNVALRNEKRKRRYIVTFRSYCGRLHPTSVSRRSVHCKSERGSRRHVADRQVFCADVCALQPFSASCTGQYVFRRQRPATLAAIYTARPGSRCGPACAGPPDTRIMRTRPSRVGDWEAVVPARAQCVPHCNRRRTDPRALGRHSITGMSYARWRRRGISPYCTVYRRGMVPTRGSRRRAAATGAPPPRAQKLPAAHRGPGCLFRCFSTRRTRFAIFSPQQCRHRPALMWSAICRFARLHVVRFVYFWSTRTVCPTVIGIASHSSGI